MESVMVFAVETTISGFVSKAVNNCVDFSWSKIKKAVENRANKHQNLESEIYNVTVDVFNQITSNQYKNDQDKIYIAAEKLFIGYKNVKKDDIEVIRSALEIFYSSVDNDKCMEFKELLYRELSKEDYSSLYREIRLLQEEQESRKTTRIEQKIDAMKNEFDDIKDSGERQNNIHGSVTKQKVKSKTQEYADKWNSNMFLNDFDKRDENAGINIKLSEVYLEEHLPHYIWGRNIEISDDIDVLLSEYIDIKGKNKMLLILGQPGIGKSTLITWITANFINSVENILVYKFASDLKSINWYNKNEKYSIVDDILDTLDLSYPYNQLNGKTLILDGFDEISIRSDRAEILNQLYWKLNKESMFHNFSLIITCRENYIHDLNRVECDYITIKPWNLRQIKSFCDIYGIKSKCNISIPRHGGKFVQYKEVLGIPLILYMALALNISIEKEGSIVDVYDKIFSLDGGIYERCIDNRSFADKHRIVEVKKQIHQISRDIAIWMFENKPDEAYIPKEEYEKVCNKIIKEQTQENKELIQDFKIGSYFKLIKHCEGVETDELYFVHRSIYEYFVAETIYTSILESIDESIDEFAGSLGKLFKGNTLSESKEILQFLKYKIVNSKLRDMFERVNDTFQLMLQDGMTYHTKKNYKNIIICEMNVFANMLELMHFWNKNYLEFNKRDLFCNYLMYNKNLSLNLEAVRLYLGSDGSKNGVLNLTKGVSLCGVRLMEANLTRADLIRADLKKADLTGAKLIEAKLKKAILSNAILRNVNLGEADLGEADLKEADLRKANLKEADLRDANLERANLERTNLVGANLIGANLDKANLKDAQLEVSIWSDSDIEKAQLQLKEANYNTLLLRNGNEERILYRSELLSFFKSKGIW